jgi:hypothetical protein
MSHWVEAAPADEERLNRIPIAQNEEKPPKLLAAQRALYRRAKYWVSFHMVCTIVLSIALAVFGDRFPHVVSARIPKTRRGC